MLLRIGECSGDVRILRIAVIICSFPVPEPKNLWYRSKAGITLSCMKFDIISIDGLVRALVSSSSRYNQMHISSILILRIFLSVSLELILRKNLILASICD